MIEEIDIFRNGDENEESESSTSLNLQQGGGTTLNEQVGLLNANVQNNLNVSIFDSGALSAGGSAVGSALIPTATGTGTATGLAAALPFIGTGVAVITAAVSIAQIVNSQEKINEYENFLIKVQDQNAAFQADLAANDIQYGVIIEDIRTQLDDFQEYKKQSQILIFVSLTLIGISSLILFSKFRKK
jgi:hypothetical protein